MFGSVLGRAKGQAPPGDAARTAVGCRALGGGVLQHLADRPAVPAAVARSRETALGTQTARNLAHGEALSPDPVEDLADHARFIEDDLIVRQVHSLRFADIAIPRGSMDERTHLSSLSRIAEPPARTLHDFGPLILRHHPLDLDQQLNFCNRL